MRMTQEEFDAQVIELEDEIDEIFAEIDAIEIAQKISYMVEEGFYEVEEAPGEEFTFFPVGEGTDWEVPQ